MDSTGQQVAAMSANSTAQNRWVEKAGMPAAAGALHHIAGWDAVSTVPIGEFREDVSLASLPKNGCPGP